MIDLDHFKRINDQYSHLYGDYCLKMVANCLNDIIQRSGDTLARYGGEEFIVLLAETDDREATSVAKRILTVIRELKIYHEEQQIKLSTSIGIASVIPRSPDNAHVLINTADKALYTAKENGRDQYVVYQFDVEEDFSHNQFSN